MAQWLANRPEICRDLYGFDFEFTECLQTCDYLVLIFKAIRPPIAPFSPQSDSCVLHVNRCIGGSMVREPALKPARTIWVRAQNPPPTPMPHNGL
ncbi:hypothetical protein PoB_000125600 [Plakobranchus ocellatus]|uniref:Uncharacterized protein n=1 Tax=Plakobranchus ocellatus TaxID=259542 RepID=A0AAV3WY70_9GAST|nr:hypothetical protein PoB_000125600 [Plakobranchus ocellatus]